MCIPCADEQNVGIDFRMIAQYGDGTEDNFSGDFVSAAKRLAYQKYRLQARKKKMHKLFRIAKVRKRVVAKKAQSWIAGLNDMRGPFNQSHFLAAKQRLQLGLSLLFKMESELIHHQEDPPSEEVWYHAWEEPWRQKYVKLFTCCLVLSQTTFISVPDCFVQDEEFIRSEAESIAVDDRRALVWACQQGYLPVCQYLVEVVGVPPNFTPGGFAEEGGLNIPEEFHCDVCDLDSANSILRHVGREQKDLGYVDGVGWLLQGGTESTRGQSPLRAAFRSGSVDTVKCLLESGATVDVDERGAQDLAFVMEQSFPIAVFRTITDTVTPLGGWQTPPSISTPHTPSATEQKEQAEIVRLLISRGTKFPSLHLL